MTYVLLVVFQSSVGGAFIIFVFARYKILYDLKRDILPKKKNDTGKNVSLEKWPVRSPMVNEFTLFETF